MPSRTARLSKKGCGFATPECRAQRDVAVHPRPAPPPPLLAAPRRSTTALGDLEIRWVVRHCGCRFGPHERLRGGVGLCDVSEDRLFQVVRAGEGAALKPAATQKREPALNQVEPGCR